MAHPQAVGMEGDTVNSTTSSRLWGDLRPVCRPMRSVPVRRHPAMLRASLVTLAATLAALAWLGMGCSFSMTVGTGNRTASTFTTHSQIPETLNAIAPIVESAAEGAAKGLKPAP